MSNKNKTLAWLIEFESGEQELHFEPQSCGKKQIALAEQTTALPMDEIMLMINGRGDEDDENYVEPTGDGYGITESDLVKLVRRVEEAHGIKSKKSKVRQAK